MERSKSVVRPYRRRDGIPTNQAENMFDAIIRQATEHWKSFPAAVAAVILAAVARGAKNVTVRFETVGNATNLVIEDDGTLISTEDLRALSTLREDTPVGWVFAYAHHATDFLVLSGSHSCFCGNAGLALQKSGPKHSGKTTVTWIGLGHGSGVNPKQKRNPDRLVKQILHHIDENAVEILIVDEEDYGQRPKVSEATRTIGPFRSIMTFGGRKYRVMMTTWERPDEPPASYHGMPGHHELAASIRINLNHPDYAGDIPSRDAAIYRNIERCLAGTL